MKAVKNIEVKSSDLSKEEEQIAKQLPEPCGYRILIALPNPEEKTEGGIIDIRMDLKTKGNMHFMMLG